jgi:hypothetical protein
MWAGVWCAFDGRRGPDGSGAWRSGGAGLRLGGAAARDKGVQRGMGSGHVGRYGPAGVGQSKRIVMFCNYSK